MNDEPDHRALHHYAGLNWIHPRDFPLPSEGASYVMVGHSLDRELPTSLVTIGTAASADAENLRARLRMDRPVVGVSAHQVVLNGRMGRQVASFQALDSGLLCAEFHDGDVFVMITARPEALPDSSVTLEPITDVQPLVDRWLALWPLPDPQ